MYVVRVFCRKTLLQGRCNRVLRRNDRRRLRKLLAENLGSDEPGQPDGELVADKFLGRHLEDLCSGDVSVRSW